MAALTTPAPNLPMRRVVAMWWPLAASWLLMSAEMPALSAVVARLQDPKINLAAYGSVVFPLALIVEAPIIMLLAASTALSKDWASYLKLRRFMLVSGALLTALHILVAFTPAYYFVVGNIIKAPAEIIEPARIGLMIMTPWTWSIAYRRFNQGVLIRTGRSLAVGVGTAVRLSANVLVLLIGYAAQRYAGVAVAASAVAAGVISEAVYVGIVVRPVLKQELKLAQPIEPPLTWNAFWLFYIPLVLTSLLTLLVNPIGSAALSRMPAPLDSLAVWPVITGLIFMLRSPGIAFNEVVVALLDEPGARSRLLRFAAWLAAGTTLALFLVAATPFSMLWFSVLLALPPELTDLALRGVWLTLPLPALNVLQSWYQGSLLHRRQTLGITASVIVFLVTSLIVLGIGVVSQTGIGLYVGLAAFTASMATQTACLWLFARLLRTP